MKKIVIFLFVLLKFNLACAQEPVIVDTATANAIITKCAETFPKFYHEFTFIKAHDALIKRFVFIKTAGIDNGPAFAYPNGAIRINIKYLTEEQPGFDDNRLIVVLYHEIGHLHYYLNTPADKRASQDSEQAAFEYSLLKTKEIAEKGDCLPLKTGLKFMKLRSEGNNLSDPHVRALKLIVQEPLYLDYLKFTKDHCG